MDDDDSEITALVDDDEEEDNIQEETEEEELGNVKIQPWNCFINLLFRTTSKGMALNNLCIFSILKLKLTMLMAAACMILPVTPKCVRAKEKIHVQSAVTLTQVTKNPLEASVVMRKYVGEMRILGELMKPKILRKHAMQ